MSEADMMLHGNIWSEPGTIIGIAGTCVGVAGFIFGIVTHVWHRKESRVATLTKVLIPMIRTAQSLYRANNLRRKIETLKASIPDPNIAPEAAQRINGMMDDYGEIMKSTEASFREAEAEFATSSFRFPDRINQLIKTVSDDLSEYGRLVNDGMFEGADLQLAKFRDDYRQVTKAARGWRLLDPFESIRKRFGKNSTEADQKDDFELSDEEMKAIMDLVHKRATTQGQNTFAVHPPRKLVDDPDLSKSESAIDELKGSIFVVVFQDGTSKMMTLVELMVFTFNLIVLAQSHFEASRMIKAARPTGERQINMSYQFSLTDIMRSEMVRLLLSKIEFSKTASDDLQ